MLKYLRNKQTQKRLYLVLALLILPPFLFWGISLTEGENRPSTLGLIGSKKVSIQEYLASYKAVQRQLAFLHGDKSDEMRPRVNLKGEAWDRLLLLDYAKKNKIRTRDAEVVEWLVKQPVFFDRTGRFNENFYKLYVKEYLRMNTREFEEEIRGLLTIQKIAKGKSEKEMQSLLEELRGKLKLNLETMKKLFPENS